MREGGRRRRRRENEMISGGRFSVGKRSGCFKAKLTITL
jgi:hypothetical protein